MKKKYIKYGSLTILLLAIVLAGIGLFKTEAIEASNMQYLDLSLTENTFFIDEADYTDTMNEMVIPYITQFKTSGYFTASDDAHLYYEQYLLPEAKAHIAISHGFTETSTKYAEVIYYFLNEGYSVSIMDHRGHGYSERMVDDSSLVHIDDFDTYVTDFKAFMDIVVKPTITNEPCYLFAHSMGGGIGSLFLERYPEYFDKAVLSSPMLEIETGAIPSPLAKLITRTALLTGFDKSYVLGHEPFSDEYDFSTAATLSEARYLYNFNKRLENEALQLGGGSYNWLFEAFKATNEATHNAKLVEIPVLLFQSGNDTLVRPNGQNTFVNEASNATLIYVEDAKHELYCAPNDIMIPYFNTVFNFFREDA